MPGDGFDPKITIKKFFTGLFYAGVPFVLGYTAEFIEAETWPPEYMIFIPIVLAGIHAFINAWKHWNDE